MTRASEVLKKIDEAAGTSIDNYVSGVMSLAGKKDFDSLVKLSDSDQEKAIAKLISLVSYDIKLDSSSAEKLLGVLIGGQFTKLRAQMLKLMNRRTPPDDAANAAYEKLKTDVTSLIQSDVIDG